MGCRWPVRCSIRHTRLDAPIIAFCSTTPKPNADHRSRVRESDQAGALARQNQAARHLYNDPEYAGTCERVGSIDYEDFSTRAIPTLLGSCRATSGTRSR